MRPKLNFFLISLIFTPFILMKTFASSLKNHFTHHSTSFDHLNTNANIGAKFNDVIVELFNQNLSNIRFISEMYGLELVGQILVEKPFYHVKLSGILDTKTMHLLSQESSVKNAEVATRKVRERRSQEFWTSDRKRDLHKQILFHVKNGIDSWDRYYTRRYQESGLAKMATLKFTPVKKLATLKSAAGKKLTTLEPEISSQFYTMNRFYRWSPVKRQIEALKSRLSHYRLRKRGARSFSHPSKNHRKYYATDNFTFNDPYFPHQWYLNKNGRPEETAKYDLNVTSSWAEGITGRGILISVIDDGIQFPNKEIEGNFEESVSFSSLDAKLGTVAPVWDSANQNSHGTYCAGIASAVANNHVCGLGIAFGAKIGGVRLIDRDVNAIEESIAFSSHLDRVDIFSAAWGPTDDGKTVEGPSILTLEAFRQAVGKGRKGRGSIIVWASGNGGAFGDNCNLDGYTSSIYTLSVAALTQSGNSVYYGEPCTSTLAGVILGGAHRTDDPYLDDHNNNYLDKQFYPGVVVPELNGSCRTNFQGTSAAAPLMAGIVAMALQVNSDLSWRDVQHLVIESSEPTQEALREQGWTKTGEGRYFHMMQGFGAINGGRMIDLSRNWTNVAPQKSFKMDFHIQNSVSAIPDSGSVAVSQHSYSKGFGKSQILAKIEHCVVKISLRHPRRGQLQILVISPSGTSSQILTNRPNDLSDEGFVNWNFMTLQFWGENPAGLWKITVSNSGLWKGLLTNAQITFYGT